MFHSVSIRGYNLPFLDSNTAVIAPPKINIVRIPSNRFGPHSSNDLQSRQIPKLFIQHNLLQRAVLQPWARILIEILQGREHHVTKGRFVRIAVNGDLALRRASVVAADVHGVGIDPEGGFAEGWASTKFTVPFAIGGDVAACYGVDVCGRVYDEDSELGR